MLIPGDLKIEPLLPTNCLIWHASIIYQIVYLKADAQLSDACERRETMQKLDLANWELGDTVEAQPAFYLPPRAEATVQMVIRSGS
jgi:hypothetical protein